MSLGTPINGNDLPSGYTSYGGSSNWYQFFIGNIDSNTQNAGAAISCHVPLGPGLEPVNLGGIGIVPDPSKNTTIYFHCGLSTKEYGGRTTTFDSLETDKCKAWVQVALPNWEGVDVVEGNARFQIPTTKSGIAKKSRFDASAGLIVPITWNGSQTQSQYTPVVLKQSDLLVQGTDQVVKSIEWRPYMPKTVEENGTPTDWEYGFCRFKAETNSVISEVAMGFSDSDSTGGELSGPSPATMYPTDNRLGLYPSQMPVIRVLAPSLPDMSPEVNNSVNIYQQVAMPLVGGNPNPSNPSAFSLSSLNGTWYLRKERDLNGDGCYAPVEIGVGTECQIQTLGGVTPLPIIDNTLTISYTRDGTPDQTTFFWEGREQLVALNAAGDVSNAIMYLLPGNTQKYFWGSNPPLFFGVRCEDGVFQVADVSDISNISGIANPFSPQLDISFALTNNHIDASLSVTSSPAMVRMDISSFLWSDTSPVTWLDASLNDASAATFMSVQQRPGDRPIPPGLRPSVLAPTDVSAGRDHSYYFASPADNHETELSHAYQYIIQGTSNEDPFPFTDERPFFAAGETPPEGTNYTTDVSYARFVSWTPSAEGVVPTVDVSGKTTFVNNGTAARQLVVDIPYGITDCSLAFGLRVKKS